MQRNQLEMLQTQENLVDLTNPTIKYKFTLPALIVSIGLVLGTFWTLSQIFQGLPVDGGTQTLIEINASSDNRENDLGQYQIFKIINRVDFNQAFMCAVMPIGNRTIFVKLNIEKIGINEAEDDFLDFCQSFKLIEK